MTYLVTHMVTQLKCQVGQSCLHLFFGLENKSFESYKLCLFIPIDVHAIELVTLPKKEEKASTRSKPAKVLD